MHASRTLVQLREMILRGELPPGERVAEAELGQRLGVSRTPIRQALPLLAEEGLLVRAGAKGYAVHAFSAEECIEALHLRAALEGMAARQVARQALGEDVIDALRACLWQGDQIFQQRTQLPASAEAEYAEVNGRFHQLILDAARMPLLASLVQRCNHVPFTDPEAVAFDGHDAHTTYELMWTAHRQHHAIVDALLNGQGERAEFLFREHAYVQLRSQGPAMYRSPQSTMGSNADIA
ncbi:MAG: GntR family transcriptional regulator [Pigmentiphaga sp.]|nr:GntR family transcriptional regulator [Pigmentiphaga sp.]